MIDPLVTVRLGLPLLAAGQAQKDVTHNEALTLVDAVTMPVVEGFAATVPPSAPGLGQAWIVGAAPTGAWVGRPHMLACWTAGGWRFADLPRGAIVMRRSDGSRWLRSEDAWQPPAPAALPAGGGTIDAEARSAIADIINALQRYGLMVPA